MENTNNSVAPAANAEPEGDPELAPSFWAILKEDARANYGVLRPGFHAMVVYRLGNWAMQRPSRLPIMMLSKVLRILVRNFYGIEMFPTTRIGRRFIIAHQGAMVIHAYCTIGDDCVIRQGATIGAIEGTMNEWDYDGAPIIGNNVSIGAGAVVAGKVKIGNNVRIGPNAVVTTDVPDDSTVFAPPPRVISWR